MWNAYVPPKKFLNCFRALWKGLRCVAPSRDCWSSASSWSCLLGLLLAIPSSMTMSLSGDKGTLGCPENSPSEKLSFLVGDSSCVQQIYLYYKASTHIQLWKNNIQQQRLHLLKVFSLSVSLILMFLYLIFILTCITWTWANK